MTEKNEASRIVLDEARDAWEYQASGGGTANVYGVMSAPNATTSYAMEITAAQNARIAAWVASV